MSDEKKFNIPHFAPEVTEEETGMLCEALRQKHLSSGLEVDLLEQQVAHALDDTYCVAVSSGTAALYLSLLALGVKRGDPVLIPSYTCNSLFAACALAKAVPILVDSGNDTVNITPETVNACMSKVLDARIAIVPHTLGYAADVKGIKNLGLYVIEDCAHAFGGTYENGVPIGAYGDIAVTSLYATKLMPSGEGGLCLMPNMEWADSIRFWRSCDERSPDPRAFNFKLSDLHAVLAQSKFKKRQANIDARKKLYDRYESALSDWTLHKDIASHLTVPFRFLLNVPQVDPFTVQMAKQGISCKRPIWKPLHQAVRESCPRAEWLHNHVVSIPMYPGLTDSEVAHILQSVAEALD